MAPEILTGINIGKSSGIRFHPAHFIPVCLKDAPRSLISLQAPDARPPDSPKKSGSPQQFSFVHRCRHRPTLMPPLLQTV